MLQCCRKAHFALKGVDSDPIGNFGMQDLDSHWPAQLCVSGQEHHARATVAELSVYDVPVREQSQQA